MSRPYKCRWIFAEPNVKIFKPRGVSSSHSERIELRLDELEAIRLADLEGLYHETAAKHMQVSRATFGRIVAEARKKVALAIVNGKTLVIMGGNIAVSPLRDFECMNCGNRSHIPIGSKRFYECPSCKSRTIQCVDNIE